MRRIANITVFTPKALVGVPMTETAASGNPAADSKYVYKLSSEQALLLTRGFYRLPCGLLHPADPEEAHRSLVSWLLYRHLPDVSLGSSNPTPSGFRDSHGEATALAPDLVKVVEFVNSVRIAP